MIYSCSPRTHKARRSVPQAALPPPAGQGVPRWLWPGRCCFACFGGGAGELIPQADRPSSALSRDPHAPNGNDPAAGSPTAALLRLLLPLKAGHRPSSARAAGRLGASWRLYPAIIGSNDGRCVQMAGTQSVRADDPRLLGIPRSRQTVAIIYPQYSTGLQDSPPTAGQVSTGERCGTLTVSM